VWNISMTMVVRFQLEVQMKNIKSSIVLKKSLKLLLFIGLSALVLTACIAGVPATSVQPEPTIDPSPTIQATQTQAVKREAQVQQVEIQQIGTDLAQVNAVVRGNLTESCATLGESQVQYAATTFQITVYAVSPADRGCAPASTPFETTILLNTNGLPAGTYSVVANGVGAVFSLPLVPVTSTTPTVGMTIVPTVRSNTSSQGCTDAAKFVTDISVPDNSVIAPNAPFNKIWRLKNTGTCTWDHSYLVHYISGATMTQSPGYYIVEQGQTVSPGQTVDISVGMTSPVESGIYQSNWGLKKENGAFIPVQGGANGNSFYVKIKVNNGAVSGQVTDASIDIELEQGSGSACTADSTYFVQASITTDGPTTAYYEIGSTAGQIAAGNFQTSPDSGLSPFITGTLTFDRADTKRIALRFVGPYPYPDDITITLRVNGGEFHTAKLQCQDS
jgi:hypothetical protein